MREWARRALDAVTSLDSHTNPSVDITDFEGYIGIIGYQGKTGEWYSLVMLLLGAVSAFTVAFLVFAICLFFFAVWLIWPIFIGAPWVPASKATVRKMLELAKVRPEDRLVDLGSGDGRIIVMAAKEFGASCVGIEVDPIRVMWSRFKIRMRSLKNQVTVIWGNIFSQNVAYATVVTVYQGPEVNKQIREKLAAELKPGTRVVSYKFPLEGWAPVETTTKPDIYLYITE